MKKSARPVEPASVESRSGSVVVAAFAGLADAEAAVASLPTGVQSPEIVGTGLSRAPVAARSAGHRVGSGVLLGAATGLLVGGVLTLVDHAGTPAPAVLVGCLLVGVLTGLGGALRPRGVPHAHPTVLAERYELRAPVGVASALRDRLRVAGPAGLLELGAVPVRPGFVPAPLGALDRRVRTADEALGLDAR